MMKFKRNPTVTIACVINECLLSLIPAVVIIYFLFAPNQINELPFTLVMIPYFALLMNAILFIVSLISGVFARTKYCIGPESMTIESKYTEKKIEYAEVAGITYDFGNIFSQFNRTPSQLVLFARDGKQLLEVKNPPIAMVHFLRKKCKDAKFSFEHNKRILFFLTAINGIVLIFGVVIKVFGNL